MSTSVPPMETAFENQPVAAAGEANAVPPDLSPNIDHIITEDGAPVDSVFSEKQQRLLTEPLYSSWKPGRPFVAMANVGLFFAPKQPPFVPDVLLSLDVRTPDDLHRKANRSYFVWEYGKPPNVAIEIVSNKEGGEDTEKLAGYARIGIAFYAIYDLDHQLSDEVLRVFQISGMKYEQVTASPKDTYHLPGIDLGLARWRGEFEGCTTDWLRWIDPSDVVVPTGAELAKIALQRADVEQSRADAERSRADAERSRADKLTQQLRQLGVQP